MSHHLYRVTIKSYPTKDGKPFNEQPTEFWQECIEAYAGNTDADPLPDFMNWDFGEWIYQQSGTYGHGYEAPSTGAGKHVQTDPPMIVPFQHRKHWLNQHSAQLLADRFREWGCVVTVDKSKPIQWETTDV